MRRSTTPSINRPLSIACCMAPSRLPTPCLPPSVPYAPQGSDAAPLRPDKSPRPAGTGRLAAAGGPAPGDKKAGQPLAIELAFIGTDALAKSMAEIIQANLRQVGVQVTLGGRGGKQHLRAPARRPLRHDLQSHLGARPTIRMPFLSSMRVPSHADYRGPARPARQGTD